MRSLAEFVPVFARLDVDRDARCPVEPSLRAPPSVTLVEPRGSNALLSLAPENGQKTKPQEEHFTETGPGSGTFLTPSAFFEPASSEKRSAVKQAMTIHLRRKEADADEPVRLFKSAMLPPHRRAIRLLLVHFHVAKWMRSREFGFRQGCGIPWCLRQGPVDEFLGGDRWHGFNNDPVHRASRIWTIYAEEKQLLVDLLLRKARGIQDILSDGNHLAIM